MYCTVVRADWTNYIGELAQERNLIGGVGPESRLRKVRYCCCECVCECVCLCERERVRVTVCVCV